MKLHDKQTVIQEKSLSHIDIAFLLIVVWEIKAAPHQQYIFHNSCGPWL